MSLSHSCDGLILQEPDFMGLELKLCAVMDKACEVMAQEIFKRWESELW